LSNEEFNSRLVKSSVYLYAAMSSRLIPREDVATVCLLALQNKSTSVNRSFDIVSDPVGKGKVFDGDLAALLESLKGKDADYSVPDLSSLT